MPVALTWLLAESDLALRLVTPASPDVEVDWAHAIELEDPTPWLAGGELVLTTGLRLPRGRAEPCAHDHGEAGAVQHQAGVELDEAAGQAAGAQLRDRAEVGQKLHGSIMRLDWTGRR